MLLLVTLLTFLGALFGRLMGEAVAVLPANAAGWIALGLAAAALLTVLVLAGYLVANGIGMLRREGRRPSTALSLVLGLTMLGYTAVPVVAVLADQEDVMLAFLLTVPPVAFFSVLFVAFLLYMPVYAFAVRHDHHQPGAVIVLGARVVGNAPTPLLRSRLEAGIAAWSRARTHGPCLFVTSGGQGTDEVAPEGRVMAEYAAAHGVDAADVVVEDRSTSTEQNLRLSQALLAERVPLAGSWSPQATSTPCAPPCSCAASAWPGTRSGAAPLSTTGPPPRSGSSPQCCAIGAAPSSSWADCPPCRCSPQAASR
ncbi:MAG: ElyC/SanA/YdcF family protein [Cellulomonadaceae bacterium]